jgi:hypothetical protein
MAQDFSKGKIYKITNDYNDDVYVGSTCDTLVKRFSAHKNNRKNPEKMNRPVYALMNEIGFERFRIELIEDYPSIDKYQLRQREGHFIREIGSLNIRVECKTRKEYFDEYYINHFDKIKEYRENNADEIKRKKKEYYNLHSDEIIEKAREYRENNLNKIQEKRQEKILCECGCETRKEDLKRHQNSKKHLNLLLSKQ